MDTSNFLKATLVILGAFCCRTVVKPPNPPASVEEQARFVGHGGVQRNIATSGDFFNVQLPLLFRRACYALTVIDTSALLYPTLPLSTRKVVDGTLGRLIGYLNVDNTELSPSFIVGTVLMCAGALTRIASYRQLGRYFTFELSVRKEHKLITDGPYSIVRHPGYVGSILFFSGACISQIFCRGSWLVESGVWGGIGGKVFALAYVGYSFFLLFYLVLRIPNEDLVMRQEFKEEWIAWSKRTPYRLIPFVY